MLIGECDVAAALTLGHGEAFLDAFHRRPEVGTFVLESFAQRICVHVASVRQN